MSRELFRDVSIGVAVTGGLIASCTYGGEWVGVEGTHDPPVMLNVIEGLGCLALVGGLAGVAVYKIGAYMGARNTGRHRN